MLPGLGDPVLDSQRIFRAVMDAMAHPGRVLEVPGPAVTPRPLHQAAAAFCLAMVDFETPLWLDGAAATSDTRDFLRFHCGCRVVERPEAARFAVIADPGAMPALDRFEAGTDEFPDSSATVMIQSRALSSRGSRRLTGPGISGDARLEAAGLPDMFWSSLRDNHALFPRGVDVLLTDGRYLAALPRTTRVEG
jgi:alpha-D-ribose 1-methylphosphonate 5-triphosphate synthase subunit PhnH